MLDALISGLLAGYGVAIPVGAIGVLIIGLSARTSLRTGAAAALGVATADGVYATVAVLGGAAVAALIRRFLGSAFLEREREKIDGLSVLCMLLFAIAAMDGVTKAALDNPRLVLFMLACAFAVSAAGLLSAWLVMRRLPGSERFMIGYGTGQRNMGLLVAALGAGVPPTTFLFFAIAQFPIYLLPWLLRGIAARIRRKEKPADVG